MTDERTPSAAAHAIALRLKLKPWEVVPVALALDDFRAEFRPLQAPAGVIGRGLPDEAKSREPAGEDVIETAIRSACEGIPPYCAGRQITEHCPCRYARQTRAALAAMPPPDVWQSIEAAPLAKMVWPWAPSWRHPFPGQRNGDNGAVWVDTCETEARGWQTHATHWSPMTIPSEWSTKGADPVALELPPPPEREALRRLLEAVQKWEEIHAEGPTADRDIGWVKRQGERRALASDHLRAVFHSIRAELGKKAAGRLLDGREWNEVPA